MPPAPRKDAAEQKAAEQTEEDTRRGITPEFRKLLDDPTTKARVQLAGDLPDGEKPMTQAELEKALDRKLAKHELRWVPRS